MFDNIELKINKIKDTCKKHGLKMDHFWIGNLEEPGDTPKEPGDTPIVNYIFESMSFCNLSWRG